MQRIDPDWPAPANILAFTTLRPQPDDEQLCSLLPGGTSLCWLQQVHGIRVVAARDGLMATTADACYTQHPGFACVVKTADCLPVLVCARDGSEVAAIHAGWRGLANGVIEATVAAMSSRPENLIAWLGPAICQSHFEVGEEVLAAFLELAPPARSAAVRGCFSPAGTGVGKYQADLYALARLRLADAGVADVHGGDLCSYGDPRRFYSWRRDKDTGRMLSVIAIR